MIDYGTPQDRYRSPEDGVRPSARFAAQISAICTPNAKE